MGLNTTVVIRNDALHDIADDVNFAGNLVDAIMRLRSNQRVEVPALRTAYAAQVIETHHSDYTAVITVGGGICVSHLVTRVEDHRAPEAQLELLKIWADQLGFKVIPKKK